VGSILNIYIWCSESYPLGYAKFILYAYFAKEAKMSKKAPRKEDGLDLLMRGLATGSSSDAILGQEAAGQQTFVGSDTLPTDMQGNAREVLEAAGVKFFGVVEDDPMFQYVELPEGWQKEATGHSMWSDLVDDKGRKRAGIFYKAAFYDRSAHIGVNRRFGVGIDYNKLDEGIAEATVTDGGEEIFRSASVEFDVEGDYDLKRAAQEEAGEEARAWLAEHYPEWEDAAAYWD